jgi:hypothetical protein
MYFFFYELCVCCVYYSWVAGVFVFVSVVLVLERICTFRSCVLCISSISCCNFLFIDRSVLVQMCSQLLAFFKCLWYSSVFSSCSFCTGILFRFLFLGFVLVFVFFWLLCCVLVF